MRLTPLLVLLACSGPKDGGTPDDTDAGDSGPGPDCVEDDDCGTAEICEAEACIDGDRNNSVEEAENILYSDPVSGTLNPDDDVDYYVFTAEGGEYVRVATTVEDVEGYDTVVIIRDSAGKVVTSADGFATGTGVTGVDAVAFAYLDAAGEYTIAVQDVGTAAGTGGAGSPDYAYTLTLDEWGATTGETDAADDPSTTVDLGTERIWYSVGVLVDEPGDSDWIAVEFPNDGQNLYVDGNQDLTGSELDPLVRLWGEDGTLLGEKRGVGPDDYLLAPHLAAGSYVVEVTDADGAGSGNHWTFLHLIARADSDTAVFQEGAEPDDTLEDATPLTGVESTNSGGNAFSTALGIGWADGPGDEDWYVIESSYAETGLVVCLTSSPWGSLTAPTIGLYDADGNLLSEAVGDSASFPTANLDSVDVGAGSWYLRVRAPDDAVGTRGEWYRFNWYYASFSVAPYADGGYGCP